MENSFLIFICVYLLIGFVAFSFFLRKEITFQFKDLINDYFRENSVKSKLIGIFGIALLLLALTFCLLIYPILFLIRRMNNAKTIDNTSGVNEVEFSDSHKYVREEDEPRKYNAGYDKLIFSLIGRYTGDESQEIISLKAKYNEYEYFSFPIIYNYNLLNEIILQGSFRDEVEKNKIGLFIFETIKYFDTPSDNIFEVFAKLSDTNYAFRTHDQEISASALASILDIEIDGIDKLIFWKKDNLSELILIPLNEFKKGFDINILFHSTQMSSLTTSGSILNLLADYLSLHWKNSQMKENEALRETSRMIKGELYKRFSNNNNLEIINLFKIVEYREPLVFYSRRIPDEEENKIKELTLIQPLDQIHKKYPDYDMDILRQFRAIEINNKLRKLETEVNLDYKAKIFLKSSNMINDLFADEEIDFSAVTIGYSKFFEREVNLSVVQLVRKELGINMPSYFEQYCDISGQYIIKIGDDFKVNFNMQDRSSGKYLPPGLGQSLISYNTIADRLTMYISKYKELIKEGKKLNTIRNKSAHPDLIKKEDVKNMKEIIVELYLHGIFEEMLKTKVKLNPENRSYQQEK